jgi:hypothetical protein
MGARTWEVQMSALSERALIEREDAAINAMSAVLGVILLISPWLFDFRSVPVAAWNASITGIAIGAFAFAAFIRPHAWEEWIDLAVGLWAMISPWLLGFAGVRSAMWAHVIVGLVVAALAAFELWRMHGTPPARTA